MTHFLLISRCMKKIILLVPALAAVLASCNPTETKSTVDPLTLSFTGTGTADRAGTTELTLTNTFNGVTQNIGKLKTDKSVSITITPDMVKAFKPRLFSGWKSNFAKGCDTSNLNITQGARYYIFAIPDYKDGSAAGYLAMGKYTKNADGTYTQTEHSFWYVDQPATVTGSDTCSISAGYTRNSTSNYNLTLKPGWNHVQHSYIWNPKTKSTIDDNYTVVDYSNKYDGPWLNYGQASQ